MTEPMDWNSKCPKPSLFAACNLASAFSENDGFVIIYLMWIWRVFSLWLQRQTVSQGTNIICIKLEHCKAIPLHIADFEQQSSWIFLFLSEFRALKAAQATADVHGGSIIVAQERQGIEQPGGLFLCHTSSHCSWPWRWCQRGTVVQELLCSMTLKTSLRYSLQTESAAFRASLCWWAVSE